MHLRQPRHTARTRQDVRAALHKRVLLVRNGKESDPRYDRSTRGDMAAATILCLQVICGISLLLHTHQFVLNFGPLMENLLSRTLNPRSPAPQHGLDDPLLQDEQSGAATPTPPTAQHHTGIISRPIVSIATWITTQYRWIVQGYYPVYVLSVNDLGVFPPISYDPKVPLAHQEPPIPQRRWPRDSAHRIMGVFSNEQAARVHVTMVQQMPEYADRPPRINYPVFGPDEPGAVVAGDPGSLTNADGDRGVVILVQKMFMRRRA
ncbi:hypothetical protein LTR53_008628 [Teratosphaeriaceae sp. CCFEE 6253]|nr:hypothetical protein LTR53_008628 [Teratosphaeriaceae sp. CCFEE 6253]